MSSRSTKKESILKCRAIVLHLKMAVDIVVGYFSLDCFPTITSLAINRSGKPGYESVNWILVLQIIILLVSLIYKHILQVSAHYAIPTVKCGLYPKSFRDVLSILEFYVLFTKCLWCGSEFVLGKAGSDNPRGFWHCFLSCN